MGHSRNAPVSKGGATETEQHQLRSEQVGESFEISVGRCSFIDQMPTEVLVVTDAALQYGAVMDIAHALLLTKRFVPLLVVGVGYTGVGIVGASYAGGSLGGLFGAWVLLHEPAMFRRYCLSSPSLWWDKGIIFDHEASYAADHDDLDARVFIGVGADECPAAHPRLIRRLAEADRLQERKDAASDHVDMVAGARLFADALADRGYPNLQLELQVHPGEDHCTAGFVTVSRALRYLFDEPR
jgi:pimeloyl-ACP methyl ester carboxylesterase